MKDLVSVDQVVYVESAIIEVNYFNWVQFTLLKISLVGVFDWEAFDY